MNPAPAIQVTDASGAAVARAGLQVTVVLSELQGTLTGTSVRSTDADGRARFPDLQVAGPTGHIIWPSPRPG